jgi:hypothetical protein
VANVNRILTKLGLEHQITLEDVPRIDLYMDQVIQLFENKFNSSKRNAEEKVLTKTMINNYAKGKLLFPIKKKKYSKEHILLISLIYQLKGALSINDIKNTMREVNEKIEEGDLNLDEFYNSYLNLTVRNGERFEEDLQARAKDVNEEITKINNKQNADYLEQVLLITSLVNISNLYRKAAEQLVDEISLKE